MNNREGMETTTTMEEMEKVELLQVAMVEERFGLVAEFKAINMQTIN